MGATKRVAAALLFAAAGLTAQPDLLSILRPGAVPNLSPVPVPVQGCCKTCRAGKACGNSCISREKACNVGPGCACDG